MLMEGVQHRLTYWGFDIDGNNDQKLEPTQGGYGFREPEALSESLKGFGNYLAGVVI